MGKMVRKPGKGSAALKAIVDELPMLQGKVGWFATARYPGAKATPVAYVASIQDKGVASQGIVPRPFFAPTKARESNAWSQLMAQMAKRVARGQMTSNQAMEAITLQAAGDVRKTISEIKEPKLKESTLEARRRRGNNSIKPLVDSGLMLATCIGIVENKTK